MFSIHTNNAVVSHSFSLLYSKSIEFGLLIHSSLEGHFHCILFWAIIIMNKYFPTCYFMHMYKSFSRIYIQSEIAL